MATNAEILAQSLAKFRSAKRISGNNNSYRKDNPGEYAKVMAYLDGGARPSGVVTDMGQALLLEEDVRRQILVNPQPPGQILPTGATGNWTLTLNEEWNTFDTSKWTYKYWWNGDSTWPSEPVVMLYRQASTFVSGGSLVLRAEQGTPPMTNWNGHTQNSQGEDWSWWSGNVSSGGIQGVMAPSFAQKYGFFESKFDMGPNGAGVWRGFWMWPVTVNGINSDYSGGYEIDIVECVQQNPSRAEFHLHGAAEFAATYNTSTPILGGGYHVFGLNWQPGFIAWYVDGVERARYTGTAFNNAPTMYLMHDNKVGGTGSWPGDWDGTTPNPGDYVIEYTRAWSGS